MQRATNTAQPVPRRRRSTGALERVNAWFTTHGLRAAQVGFPRTRSLLAGQLGEQCLWADDAYAPVLANREHVPTVARHDDLHTCVDAAGENHVVIGVACDCSDRLRRCVNTRDGNVHQERSDVA